MIHSLQLLEWDTAFFGYPIARMEASGISSEETNYAIEWASQNNIRCLYFLRDSHDAQSLWGLKGSPFDAVDIRIEMNCALSKSLPLQQTSVQLVSRTAEQMEEIAQRSNGLFSTSRFYTDYRFGTVKADDLYKHWVRSGVERGCLSYAALIQDRIIGFVLARMNGQHGCIELIGVFPEAQGRGIGAELMAWAMNALQERGAQFCSITTQASNLPALRLYERMGFRCSKIGIWHHGWFPKVRTNG